MKTRTLFLRLVLLFILVLTANKSYSQKIYFSYDSVANIIFSISDDKKKGEVTINDMKYTGTIEYNSKYDNLSYDFYSNGEYLLTFKPLESENKIIIINDNNDIFQYLGDENIYLSPINHPDNMKKLYYNKSNDIIDNIIIMDAKAYYLRKLGAFGESIYILEKIISKVPKRTITYSEIANVYWENNDKEKAKEYYKKYIELIKYQGKAMYKTSLEALERSKDESFFTIYFSYDSLANIIFSISDDKKEGEFTIEGKKYVGVIKDGKYNSKKEFDNKNFYDFYSNGKSLLTFVIKESYNRVVILNDLDNIDKAIGRAIELYPVNNPDNVNVLYKLVEDGNIPLMNAKVYYLEQLDSFEESIYLLEKIISKSPDRVDAYLNIADAYWGNNYKEKAKEYYKKYIELIKSQGKNIDKIPSEVIERSK